MNRRYLVLLALLISGTGARAQSAAPTLLTLKEAEALALKNHPQVLAAQATVLEFNEHVVEERSAYFPTVDYDLTGSGGNPQGRIGAGYLPASRLFDRLGTGITLSQLITDSGRTPNLVASSRLQAQASQRTYEATRYDILLAVNQAYFGVLRAQALVKVAQQTVAARQILSDQVTELAKNKLRSDVDVAFADVNLSEARLLLLRSQDQMRAAIAELTHALGSEQEANYKLTDEPLPPSPATDADSLVAQAYANRPDLLSLQLQHQSAVKFERAERDLSFPTISLVGTAGVIPEINQILSTKIPNNYEAAALNVEVPIFNGRLFTARREAARYHAEAEDQKVRDLQQRIARDVRVAWSSSRTVYQNIDVTAEMLREASLALDLAQGRYNLGLSSIVELTQAQLNLTQAEIENLNAKYDYQSVYAMLQYTMGLLR
ncbi:MAG: TolC family protein [Terriglobia bacterium]|jgi:outer membrane protein